VIKEDIFIIIGMKLLFKSIFITMRHKTTGSYLEEWKLWMYGYLQSNKSN